MWKIDWRALLWLLILSGMFWSCVLVSQDYPAPKLTGLIKGETENLGPSQPMALKRPTGAAVETPFKVTENEQRIGIESSALEAAIRKKQYLSVVVSIS
jgi:hypothetical protein